MTTFFFIIGILITLFYVAILTGVVSYKKVDKRDDCCGQTPKPKPTILPTTTKAPKIELIGETTPSPSYIAYLGDNIPPLPSEDDNEAAALAYITRKYGEKTAKHYSSGVLLEPKEDVLEPQSYKIKLNSNGSITSVEAPEGMEVILKHFNQYSKAGVRFKVNGLTYTQTTTHTHQSMKLLKGNPEYLVIPITNPVKE